MYEVLVPVDRDESRAARQARTIQSLPHAPEAVHATVLHVFTENPEGASVQQLGAVRTVRETLREAGAEVTLRETSGDPVSEILDAAADVDADVICLAGRKRTPAGKALFGSVTQEVTLGTERAVLISGSGAESADE